MKVYFMSQTRAALKLGGEYVGIIDGFERYCEVGAGPVPAEIVPADNLQPLNFFIDGGFFRRPHPFADTYVSDGFCAIYVRNFTGKDGALELIAQCRFASLTVTLYRQCGIMLGCEGQDFATYRLPQCFENAHMREVSAGGHSLLSITADGQLALIDTDGKLVFLGEAESHSLGDIIEVTAPLHTCTDAVCELAYTAGGNGLNLVNSRYAERRRQDGGLLPFVFFERVLHGGDYAGMLCDELKPRAGSLKKYLGEFTAVAAPCGDFCRSHPDICAAALVFPKDGNLYSVSTFALDTEDGKITNIRPV